MATLFSIDPCQLDLAGVDENDTEGVVLATLEYVFAETNAYFHQKQQSTRAVHLLTSRIANDVMDALGASECTSETPLETFCFVPEESPYCAPRDRHVAHSVNMKSPQRLRSVCDKPLQSPSQRSRGETSSTRNANRPPRRSHQSLMLKDTTVIGTSASAPTLACIVDLGREEEEEQADLKTWRTKCLKELDQGKKKPFVRWATVARAFSMLDDALPGKDADITEINSSWLKAEVLGPSSSIKTKCNVDSFAGVTDPTIHELGVHKEESHTVTTTPSGGNKERLGSSQQKHRKSTLSGDSKSIHPKKNSHILLNDKLSRRPLTRGHTPAGRSAASHQTSGAANLWKFQKQQISSSGYRPEPGAVSVQSISQEIQLQTGVCFSHGESHLEGPSPEHLESGTKMSRKRFDLHQRLATDFLQSSSAQERSAPVSSPNTSPVHQKWHEVPVEPLPIPQLSPLAHSTLIIPRTHLCPTASTPSLRIRSATSNRVQDNGSSSASAARLKALQQIEIPLHSHDRPQTALGIVQLPNGKGSAETRGRYNQASMKEVRGYRREFPKPVQGVIRKIERAGGCIDDEKKRLAWMC